MYENIKNKLQFSFRSQITNVKSIVKRILDGQQQTSEIMSDFWNVPSWSQIVQYFYHSLTVCMV